MCAKGRQASQVCRVGIDAEPGSGRASRGGDGFVREHDPLGLTRGPRGHHHECVAFFDSDAVPQSVRCSPSEPTIRVGRSASSRTRDVPGGNLGVERRCRVAGVPHRPEGIDKPPPTREVECHEFWHRPVA